LPFCPKPYVTKKTPQFQVFKIPSFFAPRALGLWALGFWALGLWASGFANFSRAACAAGRVRAGPVSTFLGPPPAPLVPFCPLLSFHAFSYFGLVFGKLRTNTRELFVSADHTDQSVCRSAPWASGLGPWALGLGLWAFGPWPLGLWAWALGPWALGLWALGLWALGFGLQTNTRELSAYGPFGL
jgi:hypothetical protein